MMRYKTATTRRVLTLWKQWATERPIDAPMYFEFHKRVVEQAPDLEGLMIHETLQILAGHDPSCPRDDQVY